MEEIAQRQYEFIFILSPDIEEKAVDAFEQEIKKKIEGLGGSFIKRESLEKRNLAYPIKKNQFGYYLIIKFTLDPVKVKELLTLFKHEQKLLRYMINFIEEPSVKSVRPKDKPEQEKIKKAKPEIIKKSIEDVPLVKKPKPEKKESKAQLEDIDKKLDEILGNIS